MFRSELQERKLTLYGNVDVREVDISFRVAGQIVQLYMEYREKLHETVREVVLSLLDQVKAIHLIQERSLQIPPNDRSRFIEVVKKELQGLHEDNIARYRLRPLQYDAWKKNWG